MQLNPIGIFTTASSTSTGLSMPTFSGGIDFVARTDGDGSGTTRFRRFSAHATPAVYGAATGYATLAEAIEAVTFATVGARLPAAGIFEHDGRFHARKLDNRVVFANGATWQGFWRLEQYPADRSLFEGTTPGLLTRTAALRMVIDGAQHLDVSHLPVVDA